MPSCSMHSEHFEGDKQKVLHRDDKYSEQFETKAEICATIILYLEIGPLCLNSHLSSTNLSENCYHKPMMLLDGHVFSHVCLLVILFTEFRAHVTIAYEAMVRFCQIGICVNTRTCL